MKRTLSIALIVAVATILASCGTTKRFRQHQEQEQILETKSKLDSSFQSETKATETKLDKGKARITETIDTNVAVPGSTVTGAKPLEDLKDGKPLLVETNGHSISVRYNPGTGNIEAKSTTEDKSVPVRSTRVTEADWESLGTRSQETERKASVSASEAAKSENRSEATVANTEIGPTPWYFSPWPWIIAFAIGAFLYLRYGSPLKWLALLIRRKPQRDPDHEAPPPARPKRDEYSL